MAADETKLGRLHEKLAEVFCDALDGQPITEIDDEGNTTVVGHIAPSAAILTAVNQFLKNNNITCAPSENNALGELQAKMQERAKAREARKASQTDLAQATKDMGFLTGLPN
jgi:hypothetical protein